MSERNKAAARAVFEVWSTGEIERLDELVAPHVVHHDPYDPNAAEGLAGMKRTIELNRSAFPDIQLTVEDQVAEGDKVATRWRGEMTHTGKLGSAAPTGRRVTITGITIDRFEGGRIVEDLAEHGHAWPAAGNRTSEELDATDPYPNRRGAALARGAWGAPALVRVCDNDHELEGSHA